MNILSGFVTLGSHTILFLIMILKLIFLWYSSNKRNFVTGALRSYWKTYTNADEKGPGSDSKNAWEEETSSLLIQLHEDPKRIFVVVPSSLASAKGSFIPTFSTSYDSKALNQLKIDGEAHVVMIKMTGRALKLSDYDRRVRKAFDKAQELSAHGMRFLPITILTEEVGANLFLQTIATFPICLVENLFDSVILYNPIFKTVQNDRMAQLPLDIQQQTIINMFSAKFGSIISHDYTYLLKELKLPVLILTNNIYEEVHGISFSTVGKELLSVRKCNIHRMHIDTERISSLLVDGIENVKEEFAIVVNTWNEIVIEKIILFVSTAEELFQEQDSSFTE